MLAKIKLCVRTLAKLKILIDFGSDFSSFLVKILIVIHEALTLLFLPVSCHYTRPRSARTHLAALAGAKNVALDADLPCVFLGGGRVVQVQNCSVVVRTLVTNELDERTSVTGIVW